jgi:hypothetical protein
MLGRRVCHVGVTPRAALRRHERRFGFFGFGGAELSFEQSLFSLYTERVKPLEEKYGFSKFNTASLREADFTAKPTVLLLGQYSTGKTSMIEYLVGKPVPGAHTGPEPTTDRFVAVMHGEVDRTIPGHAAASETHLPFHSLQQHGSAFLSKFEIAEMDSELLESVTIIDSPGVLSGEKQRGNRGYDYASVKKHFADRADRILLLFDCSKLDISDEFEEVVKSLDGNHDKVRCLLNKADQVAPQELFRVYGALLWSLGKVVNTPEVLRVFVGSMWAEPYLHEDMSELFNLERQSVVDDLASLPRDTRIRRINETVKRWRAVKTHAILCSHMSKQFSWLSMGKSDTQLNLLAGLELLYKDLARQHGLNSGDFPKPEGFRNTVHELGLKMWDWPKIDEEELEKLDKKVSEEVQKLLTALDTSENR